MGYIIILKKVAVVQHALSQKQVFVELTEKDTTQVTSAAFKEDSDSFATTFEGGFQIDVDAAQTISGQVTITVQYSSSPDGQEIEDITASSVTPQSCEIVEMPDFEIQEVEAD